MRTTKINKEEGGSLEELKNKKDDRALIGGSLGERRMMEMMENYSQKADPSLDKVKHKQVQNSKCKIQDSSNTFREQLENVADGDSYVFERDLESKIKAIIHEGFQPVVILLDWFGGALNLTNSTDLRLVYLNAENFFYKMAQRYGTDDILFAQLNGKQCANKRRCNQTMLEECKSLGNNATNAIYISGLTAPDSAEGSENFLDRQYANVAKARKGPRGLVEFNRRFAFQRFIGAAQARQSGSNVSTDAGGGQLSR